MGGFINYSDPGGGGSKSGLKDKIASDPDYAHQTPTDNTLQGYKRGGVVKRAGPAKLHKGERVLTKAQAKKYRGKK